MFYATATVNELNCHLGRPPMFWKHTSAIKHIQLMVSFWSEHFNVKHRPIGVFF